MRLRLSVNLPNQIGIAAGLAWRAVADASVFYTDLGMSPGMEAAYDSARAEGREVEFRSIPFP